MTSTNRSVPISGASSFFTSWPHSSWLFHQRYSAPPRQYDAFQEIGHNLIEPALAKTLEPAVLDCFANAEKVPTFQASSSCYPTP
jgi:hypothetical protein